MSILGKGNLRKNKTGKKRRDLVLYSYSAGARLNGLKRLKYANLIKNRKDKTLIDGNKITELEVALSKHNSKTVNYSKFTEYAKDKLTLRNQISVSNNLNKLKELEKYDPSNYINLTKIKYSEKGPLTLSSNDHKIIKEHMVHNITKYELKRAITYNKYVQKLKWFGYVNKQRHEQKLLNDIEEVYGKNTIFVFGDWGAKGRIRRISMPNMSMKKLLEQRFKVFLIDEYNTSKLGWKMKTKNENIKVPVKYEKNGELCTTIKKLHSVFTSQMCSKSYGIINRDYNALLNMKEIVKSLLETKKRPIEFTIIKKQQPLVDTCLLERGNRLHIGIT